MLHGMWERRVLSVGPAADVKLIGLSITGGRALEYSAQRGDRAVIEGGAVFVSQGGAASLTDCDVYDHAAREVCTFPV